MNTACLTSKRAWPTQEAADRALAKIRARPRTVVVPERSYFCPWCEQYHLTSHDHKPKSRIVRNAKRRTRR